MKRILLTLSLAGCITSAFAQTQDLEIRRSDMSYAGQNFQFQEDTSVALSGTFQNAGQNQRWDFSVLDNNGSYTTRFLAPDSTNGGDSVNGCNLVIQDDDQIEEYTFLNASGTELRVVGISGDTLGTYSDLSPRPMVFPLKYGSAWTDSTRQTKTFTGPDVSPFDSVVLQLFIVINYSCDGQGQLVLPVDSIEALRIKQDVYYEYAASGYVSGNGFPIQSGSSGALSYSFVNKDGGYYAATVEMKANQTNVGEISYRSASLVSVKNLAEKQAANLYPNPAQNQFQIEAQQAGTMQIFDLQGKLVLANQTLTIGTNQIDISTLESGNYFIRIHNQDGTVSQSKLIKN